MLNLTFELALQVLFALLIPALVAKPDPYVFGALALTAILVAGKEASRTLLTRSSAHNYSDDIKTLQNKVASLSVAVGLSGRK